MDDLISKMVALEALGDRPEVWVEDDEYSLGMAAQWDSDRAAIAQVPPAQPEIIRCHECAKRRTLDCPMGITVFDAPDADGYCYKAERRKDGSN